MTEAGEGTAGRAAAVRWSKALAAGLLGLAGLLVAGTAPAVHKLDPDTVASAAQPAPVLYAAGLHAVRPHQLPAYRGPADPGGVVQAPAPEDAAAWAPLTLPRHEARDPVRAAAADRPLVVDWLRIDHVVPAGAPGPLALYLPRVVGSAVQVIAHDGSQWRLRWDGTDQWREQWNRPVLVDLGPAPPPGSRLTLAVGLIHYDGAETRVARIWIGPRAELAERAGSRNVLQQVAPPVGSLTFLSLGLFALLFWLGRRREQAYLLFFGSSLVWALRNLHYYVDMPQDRVAYDWFWWMTNASLSWVMVLVYLFALRFDARRAPWLERGLLGFVALMSVLAMPFEASPVRTLVQLHLINALVGMVVLLRLSWMAWTGGSREFRVITASLWLTEVFGVHDLLLVSGGVSPESIYLLPYASYVLFLAFLYAVQVRYSMAIREVERVNSGLEARLAAREEELRANHERLRVVEREQALLLERQRLMRDMHDGLGSTLMSSLVLVEQGRLDAPAVADLLRECVDDLRLVIDSLEPIGHDLVTLLASLRHRLGRRLESAGLDMQWEVQDLPPLPWLAPPDALQVLRIVQEVLTNVLKHAQARRIRLATTLQDSTVQVLIEDDGVGFDTGRSAPGRGLRHLSQRATRLGGGLLIDSAPGQGTRVALDLPLQRGMPA
ncbi:sensor histidine kinase [Ideonella sp. 4Y16]|uniref:7TM diverse intracellular signaling domain-containing protein n=1 Tax=Ideonella alba TaxID=2824118 RepID=UPI001B35AC63|nr:7TM diverse intracellular signaling domain-containing protein [Ideonella alba]MBQ0944262.1 sensor histidine kinase [Ideonella alba]